MARPARRCPGITARCVGILLLACVVFSAAGDEPLRLSPTSAHERLEFLRRAQVREEVNVASRDLFRGPEGRLKFDVDEEIVCDFVPKPIRGWSEKFFCRMRSEERRVGKECRTGWGGRAEKNER